MPSVLSSLANTVAGVAGGVGGGYGRAHLSRHGNKFSGGAGGLPAYEDYDYNYSAGAEHYVSRLNTKLTFGNIIYKYNVCGPLSSSPQRTGDKVGLEEP